MTSVQFTRIATPESSGYKNIVYKRIAHRSLNSKQSYSHPDMINTMFLHRKVKTEHSIVLTYYDNPYAYNAKLDDLLILFKSFTCKPAQYTQVVKYVKTTKNRWDIIVSSCHFFSGFKNNKTTTAAVTILYHLCYKSNSVCDDRIIYAYCHHGIQHGKSKRS